MLKGSAAAAAGWIIRACGQFSYIMEGILKGCEPMSQNNRGLGAQNQSTVGDAEDKWGLT